MEIKKSNILEDSITIAVNYMCNNPLHLLEIANIYLLYAVDSLTV